MNEMQFFPIRILLSGGAVEAARLKYKANLHPVKVERGFKKEEWESLGTASGVASGESNDS